MARLPGLTPHRDERPNGFRSSPRSNVRMDERLSRQTELRPAAAPVEMYHRPQQPVQSGMQQLADSLQQLNGNLGRFGSAYLSDKAQQKKAQQEIEKSEATWLATVSEARNWQEAVKADPSLAARSPFFQGIFRGTQAQLSILNKGSELLSEYYTSDLASSTDPTAVRQWLLERMQPMIEGFETFEERDMAQKDLLKLIERFTGLHERQASDNIQYQTREAASATVQSQLETTTRNQRDPRRRAVRTSDPVAQNITPIQRAFLNGVSHGESAGKYNVRFTAAGGALFDDMSRHPRIFEAIPNGFAAAGQRSSAAGRYQFTATTWDNLMGKDADFSPENQDLAAIKYGEQRYGTDSRGRNLWQALEEDGFTPNIQRRLGGAWEALTKNHAANTRAFQDTLVRAGQEPQRGTPAAMDPEIMEATSEIHDLEVRLMAIGIPPKEVNEVILDAVSNAIIANENPELAQIVMQDRVRPDGTIVPGPGTTVAGREKIRKAIETMHSNVQTRENRVHTNRERALTQLQRDANNMVLDALVDQAVGRAEGRTNEDGSPIVVGLDPTIVEQMRHLRIVDEDGSAHRLPPSAITEALDLEKKIRDFDEREDTDRVNLLTIRAHNGELTQRDVAEAVRNGTIRSASTLREISRVVRHVSENSLASDPTYRHFADQVASAVSAPGQFAGTWLNPDAVAVAKGQLLRDYISWRESLASTPTTGEIADFLQERTEKIGRTYTQIQGRPEPRSLDDADRLRRALSGEHVEPRNRPQPEELGVRETNRQPWFFESWFSRGSDATVEERRETIDPQQYVPRPDANWRQEPVFQSQQEVQGYIDRIMEGDVSQEVIDWAEQLGFSSAEDVGMFLRVQQRLLQRMEEE
jgi:muramidase (phage lysozyme)